jgi:hypothetical protein
VLSDRSSWWVTSSQSGNTRTGPDVQKGVSTIEAIHNEIERLSELRTDLWRRLSEHHDAASAAELKEIDGRLAELWDEQRAHRAQLRFGNRERIIARARAEERLERAA